MFVCAFLYVCWCPQTPGHRSGSSVSGPVSLTQTHPQFRHRQPSLIMISFFYSLVLKQPPMVEQDKCQFCRNHSISVRALLHDRICPFQAKILHRAVHDCFYHSRSCFFTTLHFKHKTCKRVFRTDQVRCGCCACEPCGRVYADAVV